MCNLYHYHPLRFFYCTIPFLFLNTGSQGINSAATVLEHVYGIEQTGQPSQYNTGTCKDPKNYCVYAACNYKTSLQGMSV